jgi:elongation factor 1-gamma
MTESTSSPFATLYTTTSFQHARVMKTLAAASLNGLIITIPPDFIYGTTNQSPAYLAKFPHGKIPALETSSGFHLAESSAIAYYVSDSGPAREQLLGSTVKERALVQMWISFADAEVFANASPVLGAITNTQSYIPEVVKPKEEQFLRALRRMELHLDEDTGEGKRKWLVRGKDFSLADLSVASSLYWPLRYFVDGGTRRMFPRIMEWWDALMGEEVVEKAFGKLEMCANRPEVLGEHKE